MMAGWAFLAESPRLYMMRPHATAQYGHVLRVSVARASLNSRTSARATDGENPISARLEPAREAPVTARNRRRLISTIRISPLGTCIYHQCSAHPTAVKAMGTSADRVP